MKTFTVVQCLIRNFNVRVSEDRVCTVGWGGNWTDTARLPPARLVWRDYLDKSCRRGGGGIVPDQYGGEVEYLYRSCRGYIDKSCRGGRQGFPGQKLHKGEEGRVYLELQGGGRQFTHGQELQRGGVSGFTWTGAAGGEEGLV